MLRECGAALRNVGIEYVRRSVPEYRCFVIFPNYKGFSLPTCSWEITVKCIQNKQLMLIFSLLRLQRIIRAYDKTYLSALAYDIILLAKNEA